MGIIGSTIGAIGSGVGSYLQGKYNLKSVRETNQANRQLAEYQYTKDVDMWNMANKYNSPEQQMARLKMAGLNPTLAYGKGGVTGNTATQTPKYQAPRMEAPRADMGSMLNYLSAFADLNIKNKQAESVAEDVNKKKVENRWLFDLLRNKYLIGQNQWNILNKEDVLKGWDIEKANMLYGSTSGKFKDSQYYRRYQAQTVNEEIRNKTMELGRQMQEMQVNALKDIGPNAKLLLPLFFQFMQSSMR